ncbi:MoaD/ThiS family protein [Thermofilum pendens]|uniref:ThiamineS protein n=1 Tax=Thermofilum pendens (strain DSM 2475 / Hrk 5) TaxID=368408 RepID=A1RWC5_THEPD|nr:MoaD/ThiS family protein [Thermofilum pendens]ABL77505.1 thiamineS protein [Thermofilum pendens Hrk 5]
MSVRIIFYGFLIDVAKARELTVGVEKPTRLEEILGEGFLAKSGKDLVVLVNDLPATLDTYVRPGDVVKILPHIGGG